MATPPSAGKRGPSVLVTDSRERGPAARTSNQRPNPNTPGAPRERPPTTRLISVDNVLQYASQIPSGQARGPPGRRPPLPNQRRTSSGHRVTQQSMPGRTTKVSEKLVLIPETVSEKEESDDEIGEGDIRRGEGEEGPLKDAEMDVLKKRGGIRGKSYAERLPKAKRTEKVARVTAYCTAQGYKTASTAKFVKERHGAKTKLYDDCLYTVYHLPLLPGSEGFRIKSSPILKSPGGKAVLDMEIERSEQRDYHEGYFEDTDTYGVRGGEESPRHESEEDRERREEEGRRSREELRVFEQGPRMDSPNRVAPDATTFAEMFVFSYGVVVFWNFTERQEKDILADLTFSEHQLGVSLVSQPLDEDDFETEELHFEYSPLVERPRVFNDMITLRSGDHMIKLAMSHAIAQSTKLSFFEEKMSQTMLDAQHVPKQLALTGKLGMSRKEIVKILGRLFKSRVDVNLSSNILDVPDFFWNSEPTLHPLYYDFRGYLEITPRIKVLNERCKVFLDLAEILSDNFADTKMSTITWIVIMLIVISIAVTVTEVGLRFGMLERGKIDRGVGVGVGGGEGRIGKAGLSGLARGVWWKGRLVEKERNFSRSEFSERQLERICGVEILGEKTGEL
ncbi:hypothetical protein HYALB_00006205 [Hymenoscyphus albidus]|uniref:DUF155 domain-containing protein n=1 Tax=Hymenoscyphus albidus TaxID=595503 RepID=A0A9N9PZX7_9HELO|nr:hypothetical protein HYALB_00006205 [Hymenoscyphus albidus]